jgi:hypothetical protein
MANDEPDLNQPPRTLSIAHRSAANSTLPEWCKRLPPTKHLDVFLQADWDNSGLGPLTKWTVALQLYTAMVLSDSQPSCIYV